jgi:hypothetical protein
MIESTINTNWVTITFLFMFGLLALLNYFYSIRFIKFIGIFKTKQYYTDYIKKAITIVDFFNLFLLIFLLNSYALLILKVIEYFDSNIVKNQFILFLKVNLILFAFITLRYFLGKLLSVIFQMRKEQEILTLVKLNHLSKISILIFPGVILLYYTHYNHSILLLITASITALLLIYKYIRILIQNQKLIYGNLFYFILYLCALEILPFVLIFKLLII